MKTRLLLVLVALIVLVANWPSGSPAQAQTYPSRPVTLVVPDAAGGASDVAARAIAQLLPGALGQQVIVENRAGAAGSIGTSFVVRAAPDGYTLLVARPSVQRPTCPCCSDDPNGTCCAGCGTGSLVALAPVANLLAASQIIVARRDLPIKTLPDLVSYAKSNPSKLTFATTGNATLPHLMGALLEQSAGIKLLHVPYRGFALAMTDLLAGRVDLLFATASSVTSQIQAGQLVPLAVTGKSRFAGLRDVPTAAEAGYPQLDVDSWCAVYAPTGTPKPVIERLTAEIGKAVRADLFVRMAQGQGAEVRYMPPDQLGQFTRNQLRRLDSLMKAAGIKPE